MWSRRPYTHEYEKRQIINKRMNQMYTLWPGCRDILKAHRPSELCVDYQKDTEDKARKRKEWPPAVYVTTVSKMFFTVVTVWYPSSIKDGLTDRKIEKRIDTNPKAILFRPLFVIQKLLWRAVRPVVQKRWGFFFRSFLIFSDYLRRMSVYKTGQDLFLFDTWMNPPSWAAQP